MANRLASRFTEDLATQLGDAFRFQAAPACPMQGRQQTPGVPRGTEQVSGLEQPGKLVGRNEGNVSRASTPHDDCLPLVHDLIQNAGQVFTQACICGFRCHEPPACIVQDSCTAGIGNGFGQPYRSRCYSIADYGKGAS